MKRMSKNPKIYEVSEPELLRFGFAKYLSTGGAGWKANGAQAELAFQPARGDLTAPGLAATGG